MSDDHDRMEKVKIGRSMSPYQRYLFNRGVKIFTNRYRYKNFFTNDLQSTWT